MVFVLKGFCLKLNSIKELFLLLPQVTVLFRKQMGNKKNPLPSLLNSGDLFMKKTTIFPAS